jgi:hypothetical protein
MPRLSHVSKSRPRAHVRLRESRVERDSPEDAEDGATSRRAWARFVLVELLAGAMVSVIAVVMNVGAMSMLFHEGQLPENRANGVSIALVCTFVANVVASLAHGLPAVMANDAFMNAFYATMAAELLAAHPDLDAPFGTVAAAMGVAGALQGALFYLLGVSGLGRAVQFVPTPVVSGYLASIGYMLVNGTVGAGDRSTTRQRYADHGTRRAALQHAHLACVSAHVAGHDAHGLQPAAAARDRGRASSATAAPLVRRCLSTRRPPEQPSR